MDKSAKLVQLAKERFGESIRKAEAKLFDKVAVGELADLSVDEERELRAEVVDWLCSDKQAIALVTNQGVRVKKADISRLLNLAYVNIPFPLYFEKCKMPRGIELHLGKLRELYMGGCHTGHVSAYGLRVEGHVFLRDGFKSEGKVILTGATIEGDLDCSNGQFVNPSGTAIDVSRARIGNNILFSGEFKANGKVALVDSSIEGSLHCDGGEFINNSQGRMAIDASRLKCKGDVSLRSGFQVDGEVCFSGGIVGGNLDCFESKFCHNKGLK